jgi:hypothetical protein
VGRFDDLFRRRRDVEALDLAAATALAGRAAAALENATVDLPLVRARLADAIRDADAAPPPDVLAGVAAFAEEARRRLALLVELAPALPAATRRADAFAQALVGVAAAYDLHTMDLVRRGPARAEELCRALAAAAGAGIAGESAKQSEERLAKLDYRRLMADLDQAKADAEARLAEIKKRFPPSFHPRSKF